MILTARKIFAAGLLLGLVSCASSPLRQADELAESGNWLKAVDVYRQAIEQNPGDIELRSRLRQTELRGSEHFYYVGLAALAQNDVQKAIESFENGLTVMPDNEKLTTAIEETLRKKEADTYYIQALRNLDVDRHKDAEEALERVLEIFPEHKSAAEALTTLRNNAAPKDQKRFSAVSKKPITMNFRNAQIRHAYEFVADSAGINAIFDEGIGTETVTLSAKGVSFEQALGLIMASTKTFYKQVGNNTILVASDTQDKRAQYEDQIIRTFHLKTVKAKEMADVLKGVLVIKKVVINEQLNTLMIRDTPEMLQLVEKIISSNDRKPAEMLLEVEILEINRTKAEQLGLDYGSVIGVAYEKFPVTGSWSTALRNGVVTLPNITLRYFKQDVDAKTLANPKIRVVNGKEAKIHIGDQVPLRASTIQDATGQTRTAFEYKDIGIVMNVEPAIHLDNSVTVKLKLEVSSLGQNLGTPEEPSYSIGTRNAETFMLLRDGETAILGGLIRDEDRRATVKVPGLADIPVIGYLFQSNDKSIGRTDVLLTITPRVVRSWEVAPREVREIYSGTADHYKSTRAFDIPGEGVQIKATIPSSYNQAGAEIAQSIMGRLGKEKNRSGDGGEKEPTLSFSKAQYEVRENEQLTIDLLGSNLSKAARLPIQLLYNPSLLSFKRAESSDRYIKNMHVDSNFQPGAAEVDLTLREGGQDERRVLARLVMQGMKPGVSYLIYRVSGLETVTGEMVPAKLFASRVVVH